MDAPPPTSIIAASNDEAAEVTSRTEVVGDCSYQLSSADEVVS
jgi:hypothetical protein